MTDSMSAEETYNVKHGGLMRCCLQSLDTEMLRRQRVKEPLTVEGDTHACQYCSNGLACHDDCWQWARESEVGIGN